HRSKRDVVEQRAHVAEMRDRHADLADFAFGKRMIAVVAGLGWQIESDGKTGLTLGEILAIERVRVVRGRMTGIGPEDPGLVARPGGAGRWLAHESRLAEPRDCAAQHTPSAVERVAACSRLSRRPRRQGGGSQRHRWSALARKYLTRGRGSAPIRVLRLRAFACLVVATRSALPSD